LGSSSSERYHSNSIPRKENRYSGVNWNPYSEAEIDRLLDQASTVVDQNQRATVYERLLRIVNDRYLNVWLYR
jgi:ABC-type transport system substrate-binding protein